MHRVLKNSTYLLTAQALTKAVSFFYTIFLANSLGVNNFGHYVVALSYFSLISSIADFGISRFLVREVAKDKGNIRNVFSSILSLRLSLLCAFFGIFSIVISQIDQNEMRLALTLLAVSAVLPQAAALTFDAIFVAVEKLIYSSISLVVLSFSNGLIGFLLIKEGYGAIGAVLALIIAQLIYAVTLIIFTYRNKINIFGPINSKILKEILSGSLPYGLLGVLGLLYFKIDTLLLSYMKGSYDTGIYGAAYKFLEAIVFVPSAVATAMFPILAKLHNIDSNEGIKKLYFKSLKILGILSIPVVLGYFLILPIIIRNFLPQYILAVPSVLILSLSIPFMFIHVPGALVLLSSDKYLKSMIWLSCFTLGFNIFLNYLFIPKFSYIAASWVTVISEAMSFIVFFALIYLRILRVK